MKHIAAFFDIDGTIFRNNLMIEHFRKMVSYEIIDPSIWYLEMKGVYEEWENRFTGFDKFIEKLAKTYVQALKGVDRSFIAYIADHVIKSSGDMVYIYSREQIKWHKEQNHMLFFISGSPDFLVSRMAEKYGATDWRGATYFVDEEERLTGELIPMWDAISKEQVMKDIKEEYELDMNKCYAYGDTKGDIPMLKSVGNAIAINPNMELLEAIRSDNDLLSKTKIILERKDVIYEVDGYVKTYFGSIGQD